MRTGRLVGGVLLVVVAIGCFLFAGNFYASAKGYERDARTASGARMEMYTRWADESKQKGFYCVLGGLAAVAVGGVLLFQKSLAKHAPSPDPTASNG